MSSINSLYKPLVSVVVPNYNHSIYLAQRLQSIFEQSFQDFEVILLDDASTDKSVEVLQKYAARPKASHLVINNENSGSTFKQWDKGIGLAKGEFIWIAETDDYCENNFLEKIISLHRLQPDISLAFCQSHRLNSYGEVTGNWITHTEGFKNNLFKEDFVMNGNLFIENYLIHKNVIPNVSAVVFKKAHLQKIQPLVYEPYMKYNADWYYYIQIVTNQKIAFISESLNYFRYNETSVTGEAPVSSGWLEIFRMELLARKKMIRYIEDCNVENIYRIRRQYNRGNEHLIYLISQIYFIQGNYLKGISLVIGRPRLYKKVLTYMIKKFI